MKKIIFIIPPHVELLDLAGPQQVFREAKNSGLDISIEFYALTRKTIFAGGVELAGLPSYAKASLGEKDYVFIPGFHIESLDDSQKEYPTFYKWLRKLDKMNVNICSVCTAAFILAEAGLLDNIECTTHWRSVEILQKMYPKLKVLDDVLFVRSGNIYTSAGISAGIDMALAIVETIKGPIFTHEVARGLVLYQRRNGEHSQKSVYLDFRNHLDPKIHAIQDYLIRNIDNKNSIENVAEYVHMSPRNMTRVFKEKTGITIWQYLTLIRIECATMLQSDPANTLDIIAARCGFKTARQLRRILKTKNNESSNE